MNPNSLLGQAAQNAYPERRYPTAEEMLKRRLERVELWLMEHTPAKVAEKQAEAERLRAVLTLLGVDE